MELRTLEYFLMVAKEENMTRAAQLLHITQPTLSRQMQLLEEEFGTTLFARTRHGIELTKDGEQLRRMASQMIELKEQTKRELLKREEDLEGEIAIGCSETHNMAELSDAMVDFRKQYPKVQFRVLSLTADETQERIEQGILDLGLMTEPVSVHKYEYIRMPHRERWGVLLRKDHPLAKKKIITAEDLIGQPLITVKRDMVQAEIANWCGDCYERMNFSATYNLYMNAAIMVKSQLGIALCFDIGTAVYEELCFRPFSPRLETGAVLAWKKRQSCSEAMKIFISYLRVRESRRTSLDEQLKIEETYEE